MWLSVGTELLAVNRPLSDSKQPYSGGPAGPRSLTEAAHLFMVRPAVDGGLLPGRAPALFRKRWMLCHEDQEFAQSPAQAPSQQSRGQAARAGLRHQQDQPP